MDYTFLIVFPLAILVCLLFNLARDRNPRFRFSGERSWSRQSRYMFVDGVVLVLAMIATYILIRIIR